MSTHLKMRVIRRKPGNANLPIGVAHAVRRGRRGSGHLTVSDEGTKVKNPSLQKPKTRAPDNSKSFKARATGPFRFFRQSALFL